MTMKSTMTTSGLINAIHQVELRDGVFAVDDLFQYFRQDVIFVTLKGDAVQVRQAHQVGPDQQLELLPLFLALLRAECVGLHDAFQGCLDLHGVVAVEGVEREAPRSAV